MSGQLFKFQFADDSASIQDIVNNNKLSLIVVFIVREGCEKVVAKYPRPVTSLETRREEIYEVLREVDNEFRQLPFFDRDCFRVRITGVEEFGLPR